MAAATNELVNWLDTARVKELRINTNHFGEDLPESDALLLTQDGVDLMLYHLSTLKQTLIVSTVSSILRGHYIDHKLTFDHLSTFESFIVSCCMTLYH